MTWIQELRRGRASQYFGLRPSVTLASGLQAIIALLIAVQGGPELLIGLLLGTSLILPIGVRWGQAESRRRWATPTRELTRQLAIRTEGIRLGRTFASPTVHRDSPSPLIDLSKAIGEFEAESSRLRRNALAMLNHPGRDALTRSGLFDPPSETDRVDGSSQCFDEHEMVGRIDPGSLHWTEVSPALQTFLGAGLDRLRNLPIVDLFHPDDRVPASRKLRDAAGRGEALGLIYRILTIGGDRKAIELNVSTRYGADGSAVYLRCHVTDVTDRLRARREERKRTRELIRLNEQLRSTNRALAELKDRYSDLYQNAPAMYFSLDHEGRILVCNDTLLRTLGYQRRSLIGRPYEDLLPEEDRPTFRSRFAQFLQDGRIEVEGRWLTNDGRSIDVFVAAVAVHDSGGRIIHTRSVGQDITARKRLEAELRQNNERLGRINDELSRKNTELDEFSYVISHDLQEPIRTLIAFSDFLQQDYSDRLDDQAREYLSYLTEASSRMRALIRDLLELSRAGRAASDFRPVPILEVLATLRIDYAELLRSRGAEIEVIGPMPTVWGDRTRIGQLLGNLICNGVKYNEASSPRIELQVVNGPGLSQAHRVTLAIRDNGIGIDSKYHEAIFQMFRRLHPRDRYEGTGAGLAICQKIAGAHGGRIWVDSQPGSGSTFFIDLPIATGAVDPSTAGFGTLGTRPVSIPVPATDDAFHVG